MSVLFRADSLQVTDDWIRAPAGTIRVGDVRRVWVTRRAGRGSRALTAALGVAVLLAVLAGAGLSGWLSHNWLWIVAAPVIFLAVAWVGLLDPMAIYLEKRHHELWVATDTVAVRMYKANSVEAKKALRAIERAVERHWEGAVE
jgi:hypothetical protein